MNHFQRKVHQEIKDNFDINSAIDFFDESHEDTIEIEKDNFYLELELFIYAKMDQEIGGEDDEVLFVMKNKSIEIKSINLWHINRHNKEDKEIDVDEPFKVRIEKLLNGQIYND